MKIKIRDRYYDLPKKTLPIAEKIEEFVHLSRRMEKGDFSIREYVEKQFDFLCEILSEQETVLLFGREFATNADIDEMTAVCKDIIKAYSAELQRKNAADMAEQLRNALPKEVFELMRLYEMAKR